MGGYGALYLRYSSECHMLLQQTKAKAATEASKALEGRYKEQLEVARASCKQQTESEWQRKCQDQQSQTLGAHTSLTLKHQSLLEEHANALDKLTLVHKENESQQQIIQSLRDQVKQLQQQQRGEQNQQKSQSNHLREQLSLMESLLEDKIQEVQALEAQLSHTAGGNTFASSQMLSNLKASIQRQHWAQTLLQYQTHGPFRIEFTLDVGAWGSDTTSTGGGAKSLTGSSHHSVVGGSGGSSSTASSSYSSSSSSSSSLQTFVVEMFSSEYYSMTIGTFLKLAEAGLYTGTTIRYVDSLGVLVGGNPQQAASKRIQSNLARRLAEHGYGMTPFLWIEQAASSSGAGVKSSTSSPDHGCFHRPGSFWFPSQGQQFQITLPSNAKAADRMEEAARTTPTSSVSTPATNAVAVSPEGHPQQSGSNDACHGRIVQGLSVLYKVFAPTILEDEENRPRITIANSRVLLPTHPHRDSSSQQWRPYSPSSRGDEL
ncbi:hypothetical protein ACA910_009900 [Epithemia clementina (nom. ined.)]